MSIVVAPCGGLCNRLRVIFSYMKLAQQQGKQLHVNWTRHTHVSNANWADVFTPIAGVTFVSGRQGIRTHAPCLPSRDWTPLVTELLRPCPAVQQRIDNVLATLGADFIAVHARRTDHITLAKKNHVWTSNEDFFQFIDAAKPSIPIYLATDNADTLRQFRTRYGVSRVVNHSTFRGGFRHTSLQDAVVDLFVCSRATHFKGSGYSSFSDTIHWLRGR